MEKNVKEFYEAFYKEVGTIISRAHDLCAQGIVIYGALFSCECPLDELLLWLREERFRKRGISIGEESPYRVSFETQNLIFGEDKAMGLVWEDRKTKIAHLISCQDRESFDFLRSSLHSYLSPQLSKVYLRTKEIQSGLNELLKQSPEIAIRVREYVSRGLIDDPVSVKKVRTDREWTDEDYSSVFQKLANQGHWLSSLRIEIRGNQTTIGRIWRDASFSCEGNLSFFFDRVVTFIEKAVIRSREFYNNRSLLSSPTKKPRPLVIKYEKDVLFEKRQNKRLIDVLQAVPNSGPSVFHANPYLHVSLLDYRDGSSYDVWVTTMSSILIVPKRKATVESLERVCNHICDEFEEGEVKDFE